MRLRACEATSCRVAAQSVRGGRGPEVVRRIFAEYTAGKGILGIVRDLNREGVPDPTGRAWNISALTGKPQVKCGDCANKAFIPVTPDVIECHLSGEDGVRPNGRGKDFVAASIWNSRRPVGLTLLIDWSRPTRSTFLAAISAVIRERSRTERACGKSFVTTNWSPSWMKARAWGSASRSLRPAPLLSSLKSLPQLSATRHPHEGRHCGCQVEAGTGFGRNQVVGGLTAYGPPDYGLPWVHGVRTIRG